jgi:hypothetical protein
MRKSLSPALDDNYLSKNNASTQVLYLNKRILSDFFQNENCCFILKGFYHYSADPIYQNQHELELMTRKAIASRHHKNRYLRRIGSPNNDRLFTICKAIAFDHRKFGSETPSFYDGFTVKY